MDLSRLVSTDRIAAAGEFEGGGECFRGGAGYGVPVWESRQGFQQRGEGRGGGSPLQSPRFADAEQRAHQAAEVVRDGGDFRSARNQRGDHRVNPAASKSKILTGC